MKSTEEMEIFCTESDIYDEKWALETDGLVESIYAYLSYRFQIFFIPFPRKCFGEWPVFREVFGSNSSSENFEIFSLKNLLGNF